MLLSLAIMLTFARLRVALKKVSALLFVRFIDGFFNISVFVMLADHNTGKYESTKDVQFRGIKGLEYWLRSIKPLLPATFTHQSSCLLFIVGTLLRYALIVLYAVVPISGRFNRMACGWR